LSENDAQNLATFAAEVTADNQDRLDSIQTAREDEALRASQRN